MSSARSSSAHLLPAGHEPFFPESGFRLLAQLKKNNEREWFNERKTQYKENVEQPAAAIVHAVAAACRARGLSLFAKDKNAVMRVYRDIRFSKDKSPFKTHVGAELRRSFHDSQVVLYMHFSPAESMAAAGVWQPERPLLQSWREAIAADPKRFQKLLANLEAKGLQLSMEHRLASMPRGFQEHSTTNVANWLKLTSFTTSRELEASECTQTGLVSRIVDFALAAKPLFEFGWSIEQS